MADEEMLQDFLLDMDFDELIPVDNFFDSYVGALSKDGSAVGVRPSLTLDIDSSRVCLRYCFCDPTRICRTFV